MDHHHSAAAGTIPRLPHHPRLNCGAPAKNSGATGRNGREIVTGQPRAGRGISVQLRLPVGALADLADAPVAVDRARPGGGVLGQVERAQRRLLDGHRRRRPLRCRGTSNRPLRWSLRRLGSDGTTRRQRSPRSVRRKSKASRSVPSWAWAWAATLLYRKHPELQMTACKAKKNDY